MDRVAPFFDSRCSSCKNKVSTVFDSQHICISLVTTARDVFIVRNLKCSTVRSNDSMVTICNTLWALLEVCG